MTKLSRYYLGYGFFVGAPLFVLMLVGTQAAHSSMEALLALVLGVVAPTPTLFLGLALRRGWKLAPILCVLVPVAMTVLVAQVWGRPQPLRAAGPVPSTLFNAAYSQLYFLPGVIALGVMVIGRAWNRARCARTLT